MKKIILSITLLTLCSSAFGYSYSKPYVAENGDYYNWDNDNDGRVETVYVSGYYKSDGTYVRGHYRAK